MPTIAIKEPGGRWESRYVEDTLETYQEIVGGPIEHFHTDRYGVEYFCDEEGRLKDLKPNVVVWGEVIYGTVFAVRSNDDGEFESLRDEDLLRIFRRPVWRKDADDRKRRAEAQAEAGTAEA